MDVADRAQHQAYIGEGVTLDEFASGVSTSEGVDLADLEPLTTLYVRTTNSLYQINVLKGTRILVQGGKSFPDITRGNLSGSSLGGSLLKCGWIGVGMRMEICSGDRRFLTSPVREINVERDLSNDLEST